MKGQLNILFTCAKCGALLLVPNQKEFASQDSEFIELKDEYKEMPGKGMVKDYPSNYVATVEFLVQPCVRCIKKAQEPLDCMRRALKLAAEGEKGDEQQG